MNLSGTDVLGFPTHWAKTGVRYACAVLLVTTALPSLAQTAPTRPALDTIRAGRVLVVANSGSAASLELAAAYRRSRGLPPGNLLLVTVSDPVRIGPEEFDDKLLRPVLQRCRLLGDTIDYLVLCRDVPYRCGNVSTTTALMFGGLAEVRPTLGYYAQERAFEYAIPCQGLRLRPATMLSAYTVEEGLKLVANSQVRYPDVKEAGRVYFCDGEGPRGVRNAQIPGAISLLARNGVRCDHPTEPNLRGCDDVLMQFTGSASVSCQGNTYLPGSLLDNLTSNGGYLLDNAGQTDLLYFVQHGVCGSYGTVAEPTNIPTRWANYSLAMRYVSGFNLAEVYLQTVMDWRMGVVVGDPLMAPFAKPPTVQVTPAKPQFSKGEKPQVKIRIGEGVADHGIGRVEVWLNDQDCLAVFEPRVPAGTTATLVLQSAKGTFYEKQSRATAETPLADLLDGLVGSPPTAERLDVRRVGRNGTKLHVQWSPVPEGHPAPAVAVLTLNANGRTLVFRHPLQPLPVSMMSTTVEFGETPPQPGDSVLLHLPNLPITLVAQAGDTAASMARSAATLLGNTPDFGKTGAWTVEVRPSFVSRQATQLVVFPRTLTQDTPRLAMTVELRRVEGSTFGSTLTTTPDWHWEPALPLAEAVLQPVWPVSAIETTVELPADRCWTGHNTVRVIADCPTGGTSEVEATIIVDDPPSAGAATVENAVLSPHEDLSLRLDCPPALVQAVPELLVDGRVACAWPAASRRGTYKATLPLLGPGNHLVQVQWSPAGEARSPLKKHVPWARTAPAQVFVRHPLLLDASFKPQEAQAGKPVTLILSGPYFRDGIGVMLDGQALVVKRDPSVGSRWLVELPAPAQGAHRIELVGNADTEVFGPFPKPFFVHPPEPPPPPPEKK